MRASTYLAAHRSAGLVAFLVLLGTLMVSGCSTIPLGKQAQSIDVLAAKGGSLAVIVGEVNTPNTYEIRTLGSQSALVRSNRMGQVRDGLQRVDLDAPMEDMAWSLVGELRSAGVAAVVVESMEEARSGAFNSALVVSVDKSGALARGDDGLRALKPRAFVRMRAKWVDIRSDRALWWDEQVAMSGTDEHWESSPYLRAELRQLTNQTTRQFSNTVSLAVADQVRATQFASAAGTTAASP